MPRTWTVAGEAAGRTMEELVVSGTGEATGAGGAIGLSLGASGDVAGFCGKLLSPKLGFQLGWWKTNCMIER